MRALLFLAVGGFRAADGLIAGKPAPTGYLLSADFVCDINHCGSWLAGDSARTGNKKPADDHSSAGFFITGLYARRSCIRANCRSSIDG
jgi:hypothetical protein